MSSTSLILAALSGSYVGGAISAFKWVYDLGEHRPDRKACAIAVLLWPITTVGFDLVKEPEFFEFSAEDPEEALIAVLDEDVAAVAPPVEEVQAVT